MLPFFRYKMKKLAGNFALEKLGTKSFMCCNTTLIKILFHVSVAKREKMARSTN